MNQQPAPVPDRQPLDEHAAASIRAYAAAQRAKTDVLASVLEDIAANGYPASESGVWWKEARDAHPERLVGERPRATLSSRRAGPRPSWWSPR
ncbi:hypothetical protein RND61_02860 [Streptomyces sp. TRM76323]|uniref:Uncharacterized protein n=1 Tax=Streptomyces tamarix TaxID=3078565 RepID=A0ABU3QE21_9ACTN|nr:hypothetical protein [Streptomyces tamarix]MDT9681027.1 hypothetical protein [Streptomyces tamarix]